ncbi:haloacid dehalogenase-like hydrolase domain-containing 5 [Watersipora subatra]|uniref:haloacid dehalogenase-like hydrolase domain-containing 5 n=1 Tax=Watersipora subatra TaxID=2589382 RepID=UPI00355C0E0A
MHSVFRNSCLKYSRQLRINSHQRNEEFSTQQPKSSATRGQNTAKKHSNRFGFMFDIDGVFVRGKEVFSHSSEALKLLLDKKGNFKVPTVFVTNAGNTLRSKKAEQLSERIGVKIHQEQMVMSHSPLKMFQQFQNKTVLVSGQGPVREIAQNLGFQKVVTVDNLRRCYPQLDMVDHHNRGHEEEGIDEEYFPEIEAVILFGEPVRWETNLQLIVDLLMTGGKPDHAPSTVPETHIPVLACNMDMVWMAEACMPRFGHGCFLFCLEHLYKKLSGKDLKYTALIGKPSPITYHHAEYCLNEHAKSIGLKKTISKLYCVGDNPDTDIYGANLYSRYLKSKQRQAEVTSIGKRSKMMLGAPAHIENGTSADEINEEELLDSAENCKSILVNTGVYSSDSSMAYGTGVSSHVDFAIEDDLRKPDYMVANVLEAVQLVLAKEGAVGH